MSFYCSQPSGQILRLLSLRRRSWKLAGGRVASSSCCSLERSAAQLAESNSSMFHDYLRSFLNNAVLQLRLDIMCVHVWRGNFHYVTGFC